MFTFPVPMTEIEVTTNFRENILQVLMKYQIMWSINAQRLLKKQLAHIWNISLESDAFPDRFKIAEVKLLYKKRR